MKKTKKIETQSQKRINHTRRIVMTAILSALSSVLMFFSFNVPLMPSFIKMDLSELPALIAALSMGPLYGALVCLIKNLVNLFSTTTGGVGELSNFILGVFFVVPAGIIYKIRPKFSGAVIGSIVGAAMMALLSIFSNYYVVYPIYTAFMPMEAIIGMYQAINPSVRTLWDCLIIFNMPFTFIKGMVSAVITIAVYKKLTPLINGRE
ncbi:MAG: ECF transporter S component [Clostridia bacterium]|nr:ECF transporter S component [Clostridia bacterium]